MSKLKVVLISGKKYHGKDTFGDLLGWQLTNKGKNVHTMAFAGHLKQLCMMLFKKLTPEHTFGSLKEEKIDGYNRTAREIMQHIGEYFRSVDNSYWINVLKDKIKNNVFNSNVQYVIVTDCRYPNELDWSDMNEYVDRVYKVRVIRPEITSYDGHISEVALDAYENFNFKVINDGTIDDLRQTAKNIADHIISENS